MIEILSSAPDFVADGYHKGSFIHFNSAELRGSWAVLFFYPRDFSYVCPTEIMELSRRAPEFEKLGARIIGISCDSEFSHRSWARELGGVAFPLIADFEKNISRTYGVLMEGGFPARATFILNPEGKVCHICVNTADVGRSIAETLRTVEALQLGALTPVEWHRGEPSIPED